MLEVSLPNRAPPPPGWSPDDVGGVPWHKQRAFETVPARAAVARGEEAMRRLLQDEAQLMAEGPPSANRQGGRIGKVVAAAVGKRVLCRGRMGGMAQGVYQHNGRIRDDASRVALKPADFAVAAGNKDKKPLLCIVLEENEDVSLQDLIDEHGAVAISDNPQNDPHCTQCGGGDSLPGNEILLCDGLNCDHCFHQRCCEPHVASVPEGSWLCQSCEAKGNQVDPQVLEDARNAQEAMGGEECIRVVRNDGCGEQDIELLIDMLDVIDSSLPLIGRANAAKVLFAPDHHSLVLVRESEKTRRVLGGIVLKPHCSRGFLEIAFCVVRKEEQRGGFGSRLLARLKQHALSLGVLHLLTYADDSATGFFERHGFDASPPCGMAINRFHWAISHYIGSQLRQAVLDPDGKTLFAYEYPHPLPPNSRRLPPLDGRRAEHSSLRDESGG